MSVLHKVNNKADTMSCPSTMLNHPYTDNLQQCNVSNLHVVTENWQHVADQFAVTLQ